MPPHPLSSAGGGEATGDTLLATLTFANTAGSGTPAESYVAFGMAFKKGDVPSSSVPELRVSSSPIPAQYDLRNTWPDGSLRWCEVSCIHPAIAGSGTSDVEVWSVTGSYDNTPSRTVDDVDATGGHDFNVAITAATDYTGSTYAGGTLDAAFNDGTIDVVKSGPVCVQWRSWMPFDTQTDENLAAWFYVTAWTKDSDGTLGPISHIAKVHNGFIEVANPTKYYYDCAYKNGGSTIRTFEVDATFTVLSQANNTITCTAHGRQTGDPVTFRNSGGALPTGLVANTVYYVFKIDANTLSVHTTCGAAVFGVSGFADITGDGSGTNTLEFRVIHHNKSAWFTCDTDGLSDWTANEATIFVKPDKAYLKSTGLIPPYDTGITPSKASITPGDYRPMAWCGSADTSNGISGFPYGISPSLGSAGGSTMRGYLPQWSVEAFLSQHNSFITQSRVLALAQASMPGNMINEATGRIPTFRGSSMPYGDTGDYTGLGTNHKGTFFFTNSVNSLNGVPGDMPAVGGDGGLWTNDGTYYTADWPHHPQCMHYTIVTEGGAHLIDAAIIQANNSLMPINAGGGGTGYGAYQRIQRITSGDSYYYGLYINYGETTSGNSTRAIAWSLFFQAYTYSVTPDDWDEKVYLSDLMVSNATYANDIIAASGANFQATGAWHFNSDWLYDTQPFHAFLTSAVAQAYKITEDSELLGWADHLKKFRVNGADGTVPCVASALSQYYVVFDEGGNVDGDTHYSAAADVGFTLSSGAGTQVLFSVTDLGNNVLTLEASPQWDVHTDDRVRISNYQGSSAPAQTIPSGLTADTWYYCVNVSGRTFKLSLTPSPGSAINITTVGGRASDNLIDGIWRPATCPTTLVGGGADNFAFIAQSALAYMEACGVSGVATAHDNLAAFTATATDGRNDDDYPNWSITTSF
jgi:hypothetical protein